MVILGFALAIGFLRLVDTRWRMPIFYVGAAAYVLSTLVPAVFGISLTTLLIWQCLAAIGGAFAFEAILKVWTQESFPTLLRSTAQGTIVSVARVLAAALALVTPRLAAAGPQVLFGALTVLIRSVWPPPSCTSARTGPTSSTASPTSLRPAANQGA